jgi:Ni/Co efflux regulator RcnB
MRKILFSLLLATTMATPALAADRPHGDRSGSHDQARSERSEARQDRSDTDRDRSEAREARSNVREERIQVRDSGDHIAQRPVQVDVNHFRPVDRQVQVRREAVRDSRRDNTDRNVNWRDQRNDRDASSNWRDQRSGRVRIPVGARPDRPAPLPPTAYNRQDRTPNWDRNWRNNSRYDWRRYRDHHRSRFHLGIYFDPFGWGYQRFNVGWRLWPNYYSSNYWLDDPSMYALPYAPYPYRWVRYYNDALLVNTFTGQVVDVMYDFFW